MVFTMKKAILFLLTVSVLCAQEIPRSEYPQPQFQREQWLTLNGRWQFEFDDANVGLRERRSSAARSWFRTALRAS
jgi:hypothetical protein